jgi:hypothetical protein
MDIGENTITVESLMDEDVTFNAHTFNGWELLDAFDGFEDIISVSLGSSNVEGLDNSMIDFGPDIISLNWAGLDWNTDSMFVLNVLFASDRDDGSVDVSAPSVFGMVSLAIIGFLIRERRLSVAKR